MKILISAYSCETGRGSEGEIAWRLVHELSNDHEITVITRKNLIKTHLEFFKKNQKPARLRFEYYDTHPIFRFYKKGKRGFLIYYYLWQVGISFKARKMLRRESFDILHHLTGGMDWMPSGLSLCKGRFIWGPVGSEDTHQLVLTHQPLRSKLKDLTRRFVRYILRNLDPFTRYTAWRSSVVLSHTPETLPNRLKYKTKFFSQTGIFNHPDIAIPKKNLSRNNRLKLIYAAELKDWKGARIALDAALNAFELGLEADLIIIGDGPLSYEMKNTAKLHPQGQHVSFLGKVPMKKIVHYLYESDLMLFPSFHHGLSTIVLQSMLTGVPIICIEGDATGRAVKQSAGVTVPLSNHEKPHISIAQAIIDLSKDEEKRKNLAKNAQKLANEHYSYTVLAKRISSEYINFSNKQEI